MNIQETDQQIFGQLTTEKLCTILNPNCILSTPILVLFRSENMNGIVSRNFLKQQFRNYLHHFLEYHLLAGRTNIKSSWNK